MTKPITWEIEEYGREMNSSYNDGWTCMHYMQKLLQIKWAVDRALHVCPEIQGMDEWIEENMPEWNKKQLQEA